MACIFPKFDILFTADSPYLTFVAVEFEVVLSSNNLFDTDVSEIDVKAIIQLLTEVCTSEARNGVLIKHS